jgi:maltose O-acetyltransferase
MKTEKEKMMAGEPYDAHNAEMIAIRTKIKHILHKLNVTEYYTDQFQSVINELCPNSATNIHLEPPFHCDYGDNIYAAEGVFINFGAVILDGAKVTIGRKTLIAPGVHIYTARHPLNIEERRLWEDCRPVTIGEECWIGGHVTICPGVTIGDRAVIGAGSVVTRDVPADTLALGNPARVVKKLNEKHSTAAI